MKIKVIFLVISILLYLLSLPQAVIDCGDGDFHKGGFGQGFVFLTMGAIALPSSFFADPKFWPWLANPLLFATWFLVILNRNKFSFLISFLAVMFAASFLFCHEFYVNEAGDIVPITKFRIGYWFWLLSCIVIWIEEVIPYLRKKYLNPTGQS